MKKDVLMILTVIALAIAVIFLYISNIRSKDDVNRLRNVISQTDRDIQNISLKMYEFKSILTKRDSFILKELNIKPKNVREYITNNYHYHYKDTVINNTVKTNDTTFNAVISKDCSKVDVDVIISKDNPKLRLNSIEINDTIINVLYAKKKHWWKFWNKELYLTTKVGCGDATTKRIEIVK